MKDQTKEVLPELNEECTIADYLKYVFKNLEQMQVAPEKFTPFAVAHELQKLATKTK